MKVKGKYTYILSNNNSNTYKEFLRRNDHNFRINKSIKVSWILVAFARNVNV